MIISLKKIYTRKRVINSFTITNIIYKESVLEFRIVTTFAHIVT